MKRYLVALLSSVLGVYGAASSSAPPSFSIEGRDWGHTLPICKFNCTQEHPRSENLTALIQHLDTNPESLTLRIKWWKDIDLRTKGLKNTQDLLVKCAPNLRKLNLTLSGSHIFTGLFWGLNLSLDNPEKPNLLNATTLSNLEELTLSVESGNFVEDLLFQVPALLHQNKLRNVTIKIVSHDKPGDLIDKFSKLSIENVGISLQFEEPKETTIAPIKTTLKNDSVISYYAQKEVERVSAESKKQQEIQTALSLGSSFAHVEPKGEILIIKEDVGYDQGAHEFTQQKFAASTIIPQAKLSQYTIHLFADNIIKTLSNPDFSVVQIPNKVFDSQGKYDRSDLDELASEQQLLAQFHEILTSLSNTPTDYGLTEKLQKLQTPLIRIKRSQKFIQKQCSLFEKLSDLGKIFITGYCGSNYNGSYDIYPEIVMASKRILLVGSERDRTLSPFMQQHFLTIPTHSSQTVASASLMLYWSLNPELTPDDAFSGFKKDCIRPTDNPERFGLGILDLSKLEKHS